AIHALMAELLPRLDPATPLVVDAGALDCLAHLRSELRARGGNVILTPHAGEMASVLGLEKDDVTRSPRETAWQAAADLNAVVALKRADTFVATPAGDCYCYTSGDVGLATSGSGDTLAGIIAGLAARGAGPDRAAVWGVYLHGGAGTRLAKRLGRVGYLARELLDEVPPLLALLGGDGSRCAAETP
ncbi:MAG: NAD(P)H-hydrate dehydratase, partial [Chloroflexi bacterium]|nr:NAD(P)H-hydrate dehydratase [Chloroflexota bacterium]